MIPGSTPSNFLEENFRASHAMAMIASVTVIPIRICEAVFIILTDFVSILLIREISSTLFDSQIVGDGWNLFNDPISLFFFTLRRSILYCTAYFTSLSIIFILMSFDIAESDE